MDSFGMEKNVKQLILRFSSKIDNIDLAVIHTSEFVKSQNRTLDNFGLKLVLSESISNAVIHGNHEDEKRCVLIKITLTPETIIIRIKDMGEGFDWRTRTTQGMADPESTSGRGIALINAYGYSISYNDDGNIMYLTKQLDPLVTSQ
jgi:anti-sigma regulatory factor (Ser/Thr protein kinase)